MKNTDRQAIRILYDMIKPVLKKNELYSCKIEFDPTKSTCQTNTCKFADSCFQKQALEDLLYSSSASDKKSQGTDGLQAVHSDNEIMINRIGKKLQELGHDLEKIESNFIFEALNSEPDILSNFDSSTGTGRQLLQNELLIGLLTTAKSIIQDLQDTYNIPFEVTERIRQFNDAYKKMVK